MSGDCYRLRSLHRGGLSGILFVSLLGLSPVRVNSLACVWCCIFVGLSNAKGYDLAVVPDRPRLGCRG